MDAATRNFGIAAAVIIALIVIGAVTYASLGAGTAVAPGTSATSTPAATSSAPMIPYPPPASAPASAPPAGSSTPASPENPDGSMKVITAQDNGTTITLADHERFLIQLGGLDWAIAFDPASAMQRVPDSTTADGYQGVYEAEAPGAVTMAATGRPICQPGQACPQFIQEVTVSFVIQ